MHAFFKYFGSLKWAVISILLVAAVLGVATFVERDYGMRAVHVMIYGRGWFAGILGLLALNVFCAAAVRYPWKRHQTGFAVTHLGILTLLTGSYVTQVWGVDGTLPVTEKTASGEVLLSDLVLSAADETGKVRESIPFPESGLKRDGDILSLNFGKNQKLIVDGFMPRLVSEKQYVPSPISGVGVPALQVRLNSSRFSMAEWLVQAHPDKSAEMNLGPAVLTFRRLWSDNALAEFLQAKADKPADPKPGSGMLTAQFQGKDFRFDLKESQKKWQKISGENLEVKIVEYLPYAVVENNKLISRSDEPLNPAVQVIARNPAGQTERHYVFANYPEFNTLFHARELKHTPFGLAFKLAVQSKTPPQKRGRLDLVLAKDGTNLYYRSFGMEGDLKGKGPVKVASAISTGWMDSTFEITEFVPFSVQEENPRYIEYVTGSDAGFISGLRYRLQDLRAPANEPTPYSQSSKWLVEGAVDSFEVGDQMWFVQLGKEKLKLPFEIHLDKFTVGNDPGTTKAATYQSEVYINDGSGGKRKSALISMNEPLTYGGYTFYQSSYQLEEGKPPVSIFSVNRDPGRMIKYAGSLIMVFGILLMFYMNPHYWDKMMGRKQ